MCEDIFQAEECSSSPPDVVAAIARLKKSGADGALAVAALGPKALPALLSVAGDSRLSLFVIATHGVALTGRATPYAKAAGTAFRMILDAHPQAPAFKRIAFGLRTWYQDEVWRALIDKGVRFSLSESKEMFQSNFLFLGEKYGWPIILDRCLQLPADDAVEALVEGFGTFGFTDFYSGGNVQHMSESDWQRLDQLLSAMVRTGSRRALYQLISMRKRVGGSNMHPANAEWLAGVTASEWRKPSWKPNDSPVERMLAAYDEKIFQMLKVFRVDRDELALNTSRLVDPFNKPFNPDGRFRKTIHYTDTFVSNITSPQIVRLHDGGTFSRDPILRRVLTSVSLYGTPIMFEDGTRWVSKPVDLRRVNDSTYAKGFSFFCTATGPYGFMPRIDVSISDRSGNNIGHVDVRSAVIWVEEIKASTSSTKANYPPWKGDWIVALPIRSDAQKVRVTITADGQPITDRDGVFWMDRQVSFKPGAPKFGGDFDIVWRPDNPYVGIPYVVAKIVDDKGNASSLRLYASVTAR